MSNELLVSVSLKEPPKSQRGGELVAQRADGHEAMAFRTQLLAQYEDVLVECPGRPIVGESPAGVEKFVS